MIPQDLRAPGSGAAKRRQFSVRSPGGSTPSFYATAAQKFLPETKFFWEGIEYKCFAGQDILFIMCGEKFYIFFMRRGTFFFLNCYSFATF